jgi:hypothetical protein
MVKHGYDSVKTGVNWVTVVAAGTRRRRLPGRRIAPRHFTGPTRPCCPLGRNKRIDEEC